MDLTDCEKDGFIRNVKPDLALINSLIEMSKSEEETVKSSKLNKNNISTYCMVAYSSLREILEAISLNLGYKITNHACLGLFLKNKLKEFDFEFFERVRKIRNKIGYYGEKIDLETGEDLIKRIFELNSSLRRQIS